jgi:hypothetical protein
MKKWKKKRTWKFCFQHLNVACQSVTIHGLSIYNIFLKSFIESVFEGFFSVTFLRLFCKSFVTFKSN